MLLVIYLFPDNSFTNIVAITFSALILTELLNILTETEKFHWAMMLAELVSLVIYVSSIFAMQQYFDIEYIVSLNFLWRVVVITLASWGPLHVVRKLVEYLSPTDVHIVSAQDS
jgi:phospholipid-translocating ATPase